MYRRASTIKNLFISLTIFPRTKRRVLSRDLATASSFAL